MKKNDFLSIKDLSPKTILVLLKTASQFKKSKIKRSLHLKGKSVGLLFQKPSNRTRVSFEVAIWQMGGNCIYLSPEEIDLGKRESTADVARTLSRYLDCIVARTNHHQDVVDLAKFASVPIINGLSDLTHPCQGLADLLSIQEKFKNLKGMTVAYIGDGNNVCHSLMLGCAKVGLNIHIATPKNYEPLAEMVSSTKEFAKETGAKVLLTNSPQAAVKGAHVIYSDVWVSMGQEKESEMRLKDFQGFQINADLLKLADKKYIFMHCLPAHRGLEVTSDVIDGPHSVVFDQAENRLYVQKAVLEFLVGDKK